MPDIQFSIVFNTLLSGYLLSSTPYIQACDPTARYAYNYLNEVKVNGLCVFSILSLPVS